MLVYPLESAKVSIPQWCDCCDSNWRFVIDDNLCFNPTMVRLLLSSASQRISVITRFNPTMVRLLLTQPPNAPSLTKSFQSHNGAIAARKKMFPKLLAKLVSIPQWCDCCRCRKSYTRRYLRFQSHNGAIAAVNKKRNKKPLSTFQSHNGAIAASFKALWAQGGCGFQSHNGAIAA